MAIMSKMSMQYIKFYLKNNAKLIFVLNAIMFLFIPVVLASVGAIRSESDSAIIYIFVISCLFGSLMACIIPFYQQRVFLKQTSSSTYFALPIERIKLFDLHFGMGLFICIATVSISMLIALAIVAVSCGFNLQLVATLYFFFIGIMITTFSVMNFISIKCNNLLDGAFVGISYIVIPLLLIISASVFAANALSDIYYSSLNNGFELFVNGIEMFISLPMLLIFGGFDIVAVSSGQESMYNLLSIAYAFWMLIGVLAFVLARRSFAIKKVEVIGNNSSSLFAFPLVINVTTFILLIMCQINQTPIVIYLLILALYLLVTFFYRRKINFKIIDIGKFCAILALAVAFQSSFISTEGFGLIHELPERNEIAEVDIYVNFSQYRELNLLQKTENIQEKFIYYNVPDVMDKKVIYRAFDLQEDFVKKGKTLFDNDQRKNEFEADSITLKYKMKNGRSIRRTYISAQKQFINDLEDFVQDISKETFYQANIGTLSNE